jgi:hypothetical protein
LDAIEDDGGGRVGVCKVEALDADVVEVGDGDVAGEGGAGVYPAADDEGGSGGGVEVGGGGPEGDVVGIYTGADDDDRGLAQVLVPIVATMLVMALSTVGKSVSPVPT